jgi:GH25 family lysozyme M1 (1,4-beta-N-acetylmuramidase)
MSSVFEVFNREFPDSADCWRQGSGLDVSGWQPSTVVSDLRAAGHSFDWVIIKCSEGGSYRSVEALTQAADCDAAGVPWGVYHYVTFSGVEDEIACLLAALDGLPALRVSPGMPVQVWLDCEEGGFDRHVCPDGHDVYVNRLAQAVEARGLTVGVYTAAWWADGVLADGSRPLWVADYSDGKVWSGYPNPKLPEAWSSALIWQFTSTSPEFGSLDLNVGPSSLIVTVPDPGPALVPAPGPDVVQPPWLARWLWEDTPMMEGSDVADLQARLIGRGFDPGPVDGLFGPQTDRAVRLFQRAAGVEIDGIVGPVTWEALTA